MPHNSLKKLLGMFPYFFTKDESSNFVKSQKVTNNRFKDLYNSLYDTYLSFALEKKCLIYKEQEEPYNYIMHFICTIPLLENVKIYSESDLIYEARFELSSDGSVSYLREEDIHLYNVVEEVIGDETVNEIHHDMHTQYHDISEDIKTIEYSYNDSSETIIPETEYHIEVTTFDEYTTSKGFPENDTPLNNIFDHDISLDEIGALNNIPRKKYVPTQNYSKTEPAYNNRASEDDYHYMQRILKYLLLIHSEPLAVAEIFKLYGLEAKLINRDRFLCKMFDIFKHPYHYEPDADGDQLFVDDWEPEAWEHKDKLCPGNIFLGEYFYVFTDTIQPVKKQSVTFCFKFLNGIFEPLTGDFTIDIYLNGVIYIPNYTGECLLIPPNALSDTSVNRFCFTGKQAGRVIGEWCENVIVRGCLDADWVVRGESWVEAEPSIITTGETSEVYATFSGSAHTTGQTVHFFERVEPVFRVHADSQMIQSGEISDFYATVKDDDGSVVRDMTVHFFEKVEPVLKVNSELQTVGSGEDIDIYTTVKDRDGSVVKNMSVYFFEKVEPVLRMKAEPRVLQASDETDFYTTVKDNDGSFVRNTMVHFYQKGIPVTSARNFLTQNTPRRRAIVNSNSVNSTFLDKPLMSLNQALQAVNGIYNLIGVFGTNIYDGYGFVHEDSYVVGCNNAVLNNFTQPVFFTLDKGTSLRVIDLTCNLLDGSVDDDLGSAYVEYDIFINESCENTSDTTTSRVLMYNLNYGVLISDFPDDISFIKELDFDTNTGVLSWTEYNLSEFTKYGDFTGIDYDMAVEPDDDVYYWELEPSKNETKLLNRPFVYLEDRKNMAEAMQTITYDNTTGVLSLTLNGDEIIWEPKSHSI